RRRISSTDAVWLRSTSSTGAPLSTSRRTDASASANAVFIGSVTRSVCPTIYREKRTPPRFPRGSLNTTLAIGSTFLPESLHRHFGSGLTASAPPTCALLTSRLALRRLLTCGLALCGLLLTATGLLACRLALRRLLACGL